MTVTRKAGVPIALLFTMAIGVAARETSATQDPPPPVQSPPAQNPPTPIVPPPTPQPAPALENTTVVPASLTVSELRRRRDALDVLEGAFKAVVTAAAKETMRELEAIQQQPVPFLTNSPARARGFHLEGYGVFLHVEIPGVRASVVSAFEQLQRRNPVDRNPAERTAESGPGVPFNANATYTAAVKRQLTDAMLDYSQPLELRPYEWLTVAARDGDEPIPNLVYESITMIVRAKGSDLADFRAGRITREEMLKRVEVRGF